MIEHFKSGDPFKALIAPIKSIAKGFKKINELIKLILKWFMKALDLIKYILNPTLLIEDIIHGLKEGIKVLFTGTVGSLSGGPKKRKRKRKKITSNSKNKYCFKTRLLKILILIVFPALAIFIDRGFGAFIPIIISSALTFYLYYFPGLIFTSIYLLV